MPSTDPGPQHGNLGAESPSRCSQFNLRATATIRRSRCQALPTSKIQRRRSFEGGNRLIGLRRLLLTSIHDMYGTTHEGASSHLRGIPAKVLTLLAVARDGVEERHVCGGQLKRWRFQVCSEVLPMGRAQDRRAATPTGAAPALVGPPVSGPQMHRNNGWTEDPTVTDQSNRGEQDGR